MYNHTILVRLITHKSIIISITIIVIVITNNYDYHSSSSYYHYTALRNKTRQAAGSPPRLSSADVMKACRPEYTTYNMMYYSIT